VLNIMSNPESERILARRQHVGDKRYILVICDESIIGQIFEEGNKILDLTVSFYKGEPIDEEELLKAMKKAYILNITGKHSIEFVQKNGFFTDNDKILIIQDVPHIECMLI